MTCDVQLTWIHKVHEGPQLSQAVLYRRPRQNEPPRTAQLLARNSDISIRVAYAMPLVQHDDGPGWKRQLTAAAADLFVGDDDDTGRACAAHFVQFFNVA